VPRYDECAKGGNCQDIKKRENRCRGVKSDKGDKGVKRCRSTKRAKRSKHKNDTQVKKGIISIK
jgi:hypothetical protein